MRRMQRVADQHGIPRPPALVPDPGEIAPHRFVRDQFVAVERRSEYLLADGLRLIDTLVGKTVSLPRRGIAFDQERAHARRITIVMRVERAEFGRDKILRQRLEAL